MACGSGSGIETRLPTRRPRRARSPEVTGPSARNGGPKPARLPGAMRPPKPGRTAQLSVQMARPRPAAARPVAKWPKPGPMARPQGPVRPVRPARRPGRPARPPVRAPAGPGPSRPPVRPRARPPAVNKMDLNGKSGKLIIKLIKMKLNWKRQIEKWKTPARCGR